MTPSLEIQCQGARLNPTAIIQGCLHLTVVKETKTERHTGRVQDSSGSSVSQVLIPFNVVSIWRNKEASRGSQAGPKDFFHCHFHHRSLHLPAFPSLTPKVLTPEYLPGFLSWPLPPGLKCSFSRSLTLATLFEVTTPHLLPNTQHYC